MAHPGSTTVRLGGRQPGDDEPDRLRASIAAALSAIKPLPDRFVLVLDDVHLLRSGPARAVVAALAARMAPGTTLALASREDLPIPLGRLRSQDEVVELHAPSLAMTRSETVAVLRLAGVSLAADELDRLVERTAGWPAALRLAVRAVAEQQDASAAVDAFGGDDGTVVDYVREEVLADLDPAGPRVPPADVHPGDAERAGLRCRARPARLRRGAAQARRRQCAPPPP